MSNAVESLDELQCNTSRFFPPEDSHRPPCSARRIVPPLPTLCRTNVRSSSPPGGSDPASVTFMSSLCILYLCIIIISLWSAASPGYPRKPWASLTLDRHQSMWCIRRTHGPVRPVLTPASRSRTSAERCWRLCAGAEPPARRSATSTQFFSSSPPPVTFSPHPALGRWDLCVSLRLSFFLCVCM